MFIAVLHLLFGAVTPSFADVGSTAPELSWEFAGAIGAVSSGSLSAGLSIGHIVQSPSFLPAMRMSAGFSLLTTGLGRIQSRDAGGTFFLMQAIRQPELDASGFQFGIALGGALLTFTDPGTVVDRALHFTLGATGGYEFALGNGVGLGPEGFLLFHTAVPEVPAFGLVARLRLRY